MITKKIIVVDLEATCWKQDGNFQRKHSEIIEIGICMLDRDSGEITKSQGILVQPEHSKVSAFCEELTSISQSMLDEEGVLLDEAVHQILTEYNSDQYTWASYGAYDKNMMREQCVKKQIDYPFGGNHINVKEHFRMSSGIRKSVGMKKALRILNMDLEGRHHRGVDDAYNTAKILFKSLQ